MAIARLRSSSHDLAIERRRYERPKPPVEQRVCIACSDNSIEDEIRFVTRCVINQAERSILELKISNIFPEYQHLEHHNKFLYIIENTDPTVLNWFGKFLHKSFEIRKSYYTTDISAR